MKRNALLFITLISGSPPLFGRAVIKCSDLTAISFGEEVKIESATTVPVAGAIPEHCDVRGTIWPEAKFAVKLPTAWNNRLYMAGNGGNAGTIPHRGMDEGLSRGFATTGTDTGHDAAKEPEAIFAWPGPNNPHAERKVIDFAYFAVHETVVLGKQIVTAYYGEGPRYSYWIGCSQGGRQGLMEAQRFPDDFDGYIVGAPVLSSAMIMKMVWNAQAQAGAGEIPASKLSLLANAVYKKCDAIDGVKDGLLDDPRNCAFDPAVDLPKCPDDLDGPSCLTRAQVETLKKIYGGVKNSAGELLFPGQPLGAEVFAPSRGGVIRSGWDGSITGRGGLARAEDNMKYREFDPPPGPSWDYRTFNVDTDPAKMAKFGAKFNAINPNLQAVRRRGGRIIHYHGWADPVASALMSIDYYESVIRKMGDRETREFYRLFLVPGMFHCGSGGAGCDQVDWLTPIIDWVEKGKAPESLIGSHVEDGETKRTRPLCSYPQVARYDGKGNIDDDRSFECRPTDRTP